MSDTKLIQTVLDKVTKLDRKINRGFGEVKEEIKENRKRLDKLGLDMAGLADDAPTIEEFDGLEKRVGKLEKQVASN